MWTMKWELAQQEPVMHFQVGGEIVILGLMILLFAFGYMVLGGKGKGKK